MNGELLLIIMLITLLIYLIKMLFNAFKRKSIRRHILITASIIFGYSVIWLVFYYLSKDVVYDNGTDICYDDWCITVVDNEKRENGSVVVSLKISNKAKRIAQKPSEPIIKVEDGNGNSYYNSKEEQEKLEKQIGKQAAIDSRLELHQTIITKIAFKLPTVKNVYKIIINEGPFVSKLELPKDRPIFLIN